MDSEAKYYKEILLDLYPCKVPFSVVVRNDKPKRRIGTYYSNSKRIVLHTGWLPKYDPVETAIHEYAHHLHDTGFSAREKKQAPHGKEFWQIYGQLVNRAKMMGLMPNLKSPVLNFPERTEPSQKMTPKKCPPRRKKSIFFSISMIIFAKICISIHCANFILRNVHPAQKVDKN